MTRALIAMDTAADLRIDGDPGAATVMATASTSATRRVRTTTAPPLRAVRGARSNVRADARHPARARPSRERCPGARPACSKASAGAAIRSRTVARAWKAAATGRSPSAATPPAPSARPERASAAAGAAVRIRRSACARSAGPTGTS
ncbi:hypothetical protein AB0N09_40380 [Streptomyces erythrochromogenes]|uniref:hypothetical protein n=1 Tax=Streptomyces erythrochromogenes TaxID=285574 RepID=UPI00342FE42A